MTLNLTACDATDGEICSTDSSALARFPAPFPPAAGGSPQPENRRRTRRRAGAPGGHGQAGVSYPVGLITPPTNDDLANALVGSTAL